MTRIRLALAAGLAAAVATAGLPARGQETARREGVAEVAADLAAAALKVAAKLEQPGVRIGYFTPFGIDHGNAGAGLSAALAAALGAAARPDAALELSGSYGFIENPAGSGVKVVVVRAKLVRLSTGEELKEFAPFQGFVRANTDIARMTGATVSFKADKEYAGNPQAGRNKDIQDAVPPGPGRPPAVSPAVAGTLVRATAKSPYAVEVRKKTLGAAGAYNPAPASLESGLAFVPVEKGQVYEVRVLNHSDHEIAVSLAVDGIDQFTFSDDRVPLTDGDGKAMLAPDGKERTRPKFSHWIVDPAKSGVPGEVVVSGWHKTAKRERTDNVLSFLVTEYGQGAASRFPTQAQGKVGLITVGFSHSLPPGSRGAGLETGFGPPVRVEQTEVSRMVAAPHEFVTVRYAR